NIGKGSWKTSKLKVKRRKVEIDLEAIKRKVLEMEESCETVKNLETSEVA
ncbi:11788_t:CDS:2, partial [Dentiscutata erythropus]